MLRGFRPRVQTGLQKPTEGQVSFHGHGRDLWPMSVARRRDGFGSALDVSVRALVLNLLVDLRERRRLGMVFISHYIQTVRRLADRLRVRCVGRIVEVGRGRPRWRAPARRGTALRDPKKRYRKRNAVTVEGAINRLKQHRAVAARCDKRGYVFLGIATAAAIAIWLRTRSAASPRGGRYCPPGWRSSGGARSGW